MRRILVIAPNWVGDTVMAQPLLARIKQQDPEATIDMFAPQWVAPVARRMSEVHQVISHAFRHGKLQLGERFKAARDLRSLAYQQAIVLPNSLKSALIPWFARIPKRTGYTGEMRQGLLNDARRLDSARYPLMVERYALLAETAAQPLQKPLTMPRLQVDVQSRDATLAGLQLSLQPPIVALCPGAEYGPAKRWPVEHFASLARDLARQGFQIWLIGSAKDQAVGAAIVLASSHSCRNLCGLTDLEQAIDLLSCAQAVVSNDSGLMHIAAALDKPLLALYGSSSPEFTPPLSPHARVLSLELSCSPCFKRECPLGHFNCMRGLLPARVAQELSLAGLQTESGSA